LLRTVYVEVAAGDLAPGERQRTDSRISLLTGIHRKELRRQRAEATAEPAVVTLNSQILARWLGDPAYASPDGAPAPLPRTGPPPSFESLVASVTRDVRSRTVLDEWLAQGTAALGEDGRLQLRAPAVLPQADAEARLYYFARNLHDHAAAASANILATAPAPFLDRSVHYDGLGLEAAEALERHAREAANTVLLDVNRTALAIADADDALAAGPRRTRRVNLGIYVYAEDEPHAE
jgi:hypothetical protein